MTSTITIGIHAPQELRCLPNPPVLLKKTITVAMLLLGYSLNEAENWAECQNKLRSREIVDKLNTLESECCLPNNVKRAKKIMNGFTKEDLLNCYNTDAASSLYDWNKDIISNTF